MGWGKGGVEPPPPTENKADPFMLRLFPSPFRRRPARRQPARPRLGVEALDARDLMSVSTYSNLVPIAATVTPVANTSLISDLNILVNPLYATLPVLHSNPGAPRTLHLNF